MCMHQRAAKANRDFVQKQCGLRKRSELQTGANQHQQQQQQQQQTITGVTYPYPLYATY